MGLAQTSGPIHGRSGNPAVGGFTVPAAQGGTIDRVIRVMNTMLTGGNFRIRMGVMLNMPYPYAWHPRVLSSIRGMVLFELATRA